MATMFALQVPQAAPCPSPHAFHCSVHANLIKPPNINYHNLHALGTRCNHACQSLPWRAHRRRFAPTAAARAASAAANETPAVIEQLYRNGGQPALSGRWGVAVQRLPGKGRCIVSTRDLRPGDLLIASEPLAYVTCPGGISPEADVLADA